jgi:hypothetical protein
MPHNLGGLVAAIASAQVRGPLRGWRTACRGIGHNGPVTSRGKRAAAKQKARFRPTVLLLALGVTVGVVAWGYLVKAAIDFGVQARSGTPDAWLYLGLAGFGAVACLFIGLMLVARIMRVLGITNPSSKESQPQRSIGGRRAAR